MLNESARTYCLLNLAHLRKVAALYGPEEAKKVAAVIKTISLLSFFSASADTLNALAISLEGKNLNGNSGAQILAMTSNEFATLTVGTASNDEKRRLKLSLQRIVQSNCDLQSDVYPMWLAAREMRKIDALRVRFVDSSADWLPSESHLILPPVRTEWLTVRAAMVDMSEDMSSRRTAKRNDLWPTRILR